MSTTPVTPSQRVPKRKASAYADTLFEAQRKALARSLVSLRLGQGLSQEALAYEAEVERSLTRLQGRQQELRQQVLLAWRALDMARLRVEALSQGVLRDAEAALRVAQAAYRFGERGILDVLDAQRVLRGVRSDLLQARYQQQLARIALDQLSGQHANDVQP